MKDDNSLIWLALIGFGIYWYMNKQQQQPVVTSTPATPFTPLAPSTTTTTTVNAVSDYNVHFAINGMRKKLGKIPNTI